MELCIVYSTNPALQVLSAHDGTASLESTTSMHEWPKARMRSPSTVQHVDFWGSESMSRCASPIACVLDLIRRTTSAIAATDGSGYDVRASCRRFPRKFRQQLFRSKPRAHTLVTALRLQACVCEQRSIRQDQDGERKSSKS